MFVAVLSPISPSPPQHNAPSLSSLHEHPYTSAGIDVDGLVSELKDFFGDETAAAEFTNWLLHHVEEMASVGGGVPASAAVEAHMGDDAMTGAASGVSWIYTSRIVPLFLLLD